MKTRFFYLAVIVALQILLTLSHVTNRRLLKTLDKATEQLTEDQRALRLCAEKFSTVSR